MLLCKQRRYGNVLAVAGVSHAIEVKVRCWNWRMLWRTCGDRGLATGSARSGTRVPLPVMRDYPLVNRQHLYYGKE